MSKNRTKKSSTAMQMVRCIPPPPFFSFKSLPPNFAPSSPRIQKPSRATTQSKPCSYINTSNTNAFPIFLLYFAQNAVVNPQCIIENTRTPTSYFTALPPIPAKTLRPHPIPSHPIHRLLLIGKFMHLRISLRTSVAIPSSQHIETQDEDMKSEKKKVPAKPNSTLEPFFFSSVHKTISACMHA